MYTIVGLYGVSLCLLMPSVLSIDGFGELGEKSADVELQHDFNWSLRLYIPATVIVALSLSFIMPKSYVFVYDLAFRKCNIFGNFLEISENISKSLEVIMSIILIRIRLYAMEPC